MESIAAAAVGEPIPERMVRPIHRRRHIRTSATGVEPNISSPRPRTRHETPALYLQRGWIDNVLEIAACTLSLSLSLSLSPLSLSLSLSRSRSRNTGNNTHQAAIRPLSSLVLESSLREVRRYVDSQVCARVPAARR